MTSQFIGAYFLDASPVNDALTQIQTQLIGMKDAKGNVLFYNAEFDTEVFRLPKASEMPLCKIVHSTDSFKSESANGIFHDGKVSFSLMLYYQCATEDKATLQLIRENFCHHIIKRLQGTNSGVTDSTGIIPTINWRFTYDPGTTFTIEHTNPLDIFGGIGKFPQPNYVSRIDLQIDVFNLQN